MPRSVFTDEYADLVSLLIEARRGVSITQVELALRLNRPQSFVSKVERRERRLDVIEFCEIADALGFEADKLLAEFLARRGRADQRDSPDG